MREPKLSLGHTYRLVLSDDVRGCGQTIEFEAWGAESALFQAQRYCSDRDAELIEDGRSLGRLRLHGNGGFWSLTPPVGPNGGG